MLSGVKFIPRDQIDKDENSDALKQGKKSSRKEKGRLKNKSSRYSSSDEDLKRLSRGSKKKKWYSSDEYSLSSHSSEGEDENSSFSDEKRHRSRKTSKYDAADVSNSKKKSRSGKEKYGGKKSKKRGSQGDISDCDLSDGGGENSLKDMEIVRKEIGLEWMLRPEAKTDRKPTMTVDDEPEKALADEIKVNPRELNPYLKNDGSGYPEDNSELKAGGKKLLPSSTVGDGGVSWRLKALKRAKEQAAREGRRLNEVVEERWESLGQLTVSVASQKAAPSRAHLHAIKSRKREITDDHQTGSEGQSEKDIEKRSSREYLKDVSLQLPKMREPRVQESLSWGKKKSQTTFTKDSSIVYDAVSNINKFENDGSFMHEVLHKQSSAGGPIGENIKPNLVSVDAGRPSESGGAVKDASSANQLAAKAFQLRLKGKHEEADKLLQDVENMKAKQGGGDNLIRRQKEEISSRYSVKDKSLQKKNEDDADMHLAQKIMQNKRYSTSTQADDEYDYDDGSIRKSRKKQGGDDHKVSEKNTHAYRFATQQDRCLFCFENPKRPAHLVVALANFSYLMLPQWEPLVPGHCCILPMQHVPATRTVDDDVWEEIRNFKKCLIMMFAEQEKDVVFLETVMGLAQQRRHCLVECIPLPRDIAKEAPLYFKKAIDEAEDEWSQHNAKKLIDTSVKGLRASIPAHFPYFHVEFGLYKGFVHVIDDEKQFKSSLGLNVIRGMLQLPEEDMYRRRRYESVEAQKQAVKSFARDWAPFDWTKELNQ